MSCDLMGIADIQQVQEAFMNRQDLRSIANWRGNIDTHLEPDFSIAPYARPTSRFYSIQSKSLLSRHAQRIEKRGGGLELALRIRL